MRSKRDVVGGPVRTLVLACAVALAACHGKTDRLVPSAGAATASVAPAAAWDAEDAGAARVEAPARACAPIDPAKVAPFTVDRSKLDVAVPEIVDAAGALDPFYERVALLSRGLARTPVRVAVFGDSNLTGDVLTSQMRRLLQARFADSGHGFVALARPWGWYHHRDVRHSGTWPLFKQIAVTTDPIADKQYGMNNFAAETRTAGAAAWVGTVRDEAASVGTRVSRFDVYFLKQRRGGSFDLQLDGKVERTVSTKAEGFEAGYETVEAPDGAHDLKCVVKGDGPVRFFGAVLERDAPGFVVDSFGAGSLNFQRIMMVDSAVRRDQLARRRHDLVILWLGMNSMWLPPNRQWIKDVIGELRAAVPGVPILVTTPPDSVKEGERKSDPRIVALEKQLREVAAESGAAFWDFREAMGGDTSFLFFMRHRLASPDRHHLLDEGSEIMGERLVSALFAGVGKHLAAHPDAGCAAAR